MPQKQTFVMIKPDGVQRELVGELISRLERKGLQLAAVKMRLIDKELAATHYAEHKGKPFYPKLIEFITSAPVVLTVWQGENAISVVRKILGATSPEEALPGTIRGDYAISTSLNLVHASDSIESAQREIKLFFKDDEILDYNLTIKRWLVP